MLGSDGSDREYKIELEVESSEESDYCWSKRRKPQRRIKKRSSGEVLEWEEDDEISVLKQLYKFSGKKAAYSKAFYEYVKPRLRNKEVTMSEMNTKIGGFKEQYLENIEYRRTKGNNNNEFKFSGPHQRQVFVLSKRIWGDYGNEENMGMKHLEGFREFLGDMEIDVNCLMPSSLEYLKKEWEVQLLMYIQLLSKKSKFDAKLRELIMSAKSDLNTSPT